LTQFADGLRCMDETMYRFGVRDVSLMIEELQDQSHRLGAGTRDMMVSAFSEMTRRSRGVRLVTFGQDTQNFVQLLSLAQRSNEFKVAPQYDIRGSITQFDEDVIREESGVKLVEPGYGPSTRFTSNSGSRMDGLIPEAYAPFAQRIFVSFAQPGAVTTESDVADAVWHAANDASGQLRFPAGADAVALTQSNQEARTS